MAGFNENLKYVQKGYAQVEPNHLSAQRTGQIYAQYPAAASIAVLENGQFVKYDAANGVVGTSGDGEWLLVFNEPKHYYDYEPDCYFAMKKENYNARIYSAGDIAEDGTGKARDYAGMAQAGIALDGTTDPFNVTAYEATKAMPAGSTMVPRLFKTNVGDIFTTNAIVETTVELGAKLGINTSGYLSTAATTSDMKWQVVKVYTMPDGQPGVKIMRIA